MPNHMPFDYENRTACRACGVTISHANQLGDECPGADDSVVRERDRYRDLLRWLLEDFCRMPDAGLTSDDPRWRWWHDTAGSRAQARAELDWDQVAPRKEGRDR